MVVNDRGQQEIIGDLNSDDAEGNFTLDDTQLRTQNRRRNLWKKNIIKPLDPVTLRSDEDQRIKKQIEEEEYILTEYHKGGTESSSSRHPFDDNENSRGSQTKRRGRGRTSKRENTVTEIVCKNRLTTQALYDTDGEEEEETNIDVNSDEFEGNYENDDYVDIMDDDDEDSKQPVTTRSNGMNNRNTVYTNEDFQINSDESDSSEYSDWAEEEGRKTLLPPPSRTGKEKRGRRRIKIKEESKNK